MIPRAVIIKVVNSLIRTCQDLIFHSPGLSLTAGTTMQFQFEFKMIELVPQPFIDFHVGPVLDFQIIVPIFCKGSTAQPHCFFLTRRIFTADQSKEIVQPTNADHDKVRHVFHKTVVKLTRIQAQGATSYLSVSRPNDLFDKFCLIDHARRTIANSLDFGF